MKYGRFDWMFNNTSSGRNPVTPVRPTRNVPIKPFRLAWNCAALGIAWPIEPGLPLEDSDFYFEFVAIDADSEEILGAVILGLTGDEVIHCLLDVMYAKMPYTVISRAVHVHPTVAELIPTVLQELQPLTPLA